MEYLGKSAYLYQGRGPTILKLGSLCMNGQPIVLGTRYQDGHLLQFGDSVPGYEISWVLVNGILIADRCLLTNISWYDLNKQNLVFGKPISIDGTEYTCRLLKVGSEEKASNEWDAALDAVCDDSDSLWHWSGSGFWGQETPDEYSWGRACRGGDFARSWDWVTLANMSLGFRPVLEPKWLTPKKVALNEHLTIWCRQSILKGYLVDKTKYDWVLIPDQESIVSESDLNHQIVRLPDGQVLIDCTGISAVQVLHT